MQVTETSSEGLKRELQVVIAASDLDTRLTEKLDEIKGTVELKGFRKGKVPASHLRKVYGKSVMADIVQDAVNDATRKTLDERNEKPAFEPQIKMTEDQAEVDKILDGKADLSYSMSFEVLPEIEVADLSSIKVEKLVATPSEDDVADNLKRIVEGNTQYEAKDGVAEDGDQVKLDYAGTIDGEAFDGGTSEGSTLVLGSGQFIPGFEEQLMGVSAGDTKDVNVAFPEDYNAKHLAGKDAVFAVTVHEVLSSKSPELDDEFAKTMGFESLDKLKEAITESLQSELDEVSRSRLKRSLLDAIDEKHSFELPPTLVESEFAGVWAQMKQDMESRDESFGEGDKSEESLRDEYQKLAERRVRLGLVLSEIGTKNEIVISEEEVNRAMGEKLRQFPGQEQQVLEYFQKTPGALAEIRAPLFEEKVVDFLIELVKPTEKKVTQEELTKPVDDE